MFSLPRFSVNTGGGEGARVEQVHGWSNAPRHPVTHLISYRYCNRALLIDMREAGGCYNLRLYLLVINKFIVLKLIKIQKL